MELIWLVKVPIRSLINSPFYFSSTQGTASPKTLPNDWHSTLNAANYKFTSYPSRVMLQGILFISGAVFTQNKREWGAKIWIGFFFQKRGRQMFSHDEGLPLLPHSVWKSWHICTSPYYCWVLKWSQFAHSQYDEQLKVWSWSVTEAYLTSPWTGGGKRRIDRASLYHKALRYYYHFYSHKTC